MNKVHRTLWSAARGCYVVTHEKAATHGKPVSSSKLLAISALTVGGLLLLPGMVLGACTLTGAGSTADPYQVASAGDLAQVGLGCGMSAKYLQTADITLTGTNNLLPIGASNINNAATTFSGVYNGGDFTISGLNQSNTSSTNNVRLGLFGYLSDATVKNLKLTNASITLGSTSLTSSTQYLFAGALAGEVSPNSTATITNVSVSDSSVSVSTTGNGNAVGGGVFGRVVGTTTVSYVSASNVTVSGSATAQAYLHLGGFAGTLYGGTFSAISSSGSVQGSHSGPLTNQIILGGLVGDFMASATVQDSYSTASVSGTAPNLQHWGLGGLVGATFAGSINRSYATGSVTGSTSLCVTAARCGGLVGTDLGLTTKAGFWDTQTTGKSTSAIGTGKTTAEMKTASTYTDAGWSSSIWDIQDGAYPVLKAYVPPNDAPTASSVAITGTARLGMELTGSYTYGDTENNTEGASTLKWYSDSASNGSSKSAISGATSASYTTVNGDLGKYLFYCVTPVATSGNTPGTETCSSAVGPIGTILITSAAALSGSATARQANFSVTTDLAGTGCWAILPAAASAPNAATLCNGTTGINQVNGVVDYQTSLSLNGGTATTFSSDKLAPSTSYKLYFAASKDGSTSAVQTVSFTSAAATVPDAPSGTTATAGDASLSVAFSAPPNDGGTTITEYTASCAPANTFVAIAWTASQVGTTSPLTVSGLTNGTPYKCAVKAKNGVGYGNYSSLSSSATPATPYVPPPVTMPSLTTGSGSANPNPGQTLNVFDDGRSGATINLPTNASSNKNNDIWLSLPGTGQLNAKAESSDTQLGVTRVTLPGSSVPTTTVMVNQGVATLTASREGQPVAALKNGIVVVAGGTGSQVSVDATGSNAKIGVKASDTIVVPLGASNVSGTSVDLPAPTGNGTATPVNVKVGEQSLSIQATQADTKMTFKVVDIGGVKTPVLEVSGVAQVSASGDNQPLVSIGGNVVKSGGNGQKCNTVVQATSNTHSDTVQVVTCYIVLDSGSFSALKGNAFAAIKDGVVWAGETAEFDKNGKVVGAYLGTKEGNSEAVGDDLTAGGNKFAGYVSTAFVPRLRGTPLRLNGANLDERIVAVVGQAVGGTPQPVRPAQDAQGVLNFTFANAIGKVLSANGATISGETVSVLPSRRIRVDTSRADGVSLTTEGDVEVATDGLVTTFVPSVQNPSGFAADVVQAMPRAAVTLRWNGSWVVADGNGGILVGRPQWGQRTASGSASGFAASAATENTLRYNSNGVEQLIVTDFYDYGTLQATFAKELADPNLSVVPNMDGTATATLHDKRYVLVPQWNVLKAADAVNKPIWWVDNGVVYVKNTDGTAQGFTVK